MPGPNHQLTDFEAFTLESNLIKFRACKTGSTTGAVTAITGAADVVKGISIEDGSTGEQHAIALQGGRVLVEAGAAFAADIDLTIDAVGRLVAAAPAAGANAFVLGKSLDAATALGDVVTMMYRPGWKQG